MQTPWIALAQKPQRPAPVIDVQSRVTVGGPSGGWYPWYDVATDPENSNNVIVCGSRWDAANNAFSGILFSSTDGGKSWRTALEDKHSAWVTEHSCAFGVNGRAYFVSEASKVVDGVNHHGLGTTRIFVSTDGGSEWAEGVQTEWADYASTVVNTQPGSDKNRLYVFFNDAFVSPGKSDETRPTTFVSLLTFAGDDPARRVVRVVDATLASRFAYRGSFPTQAFLLNDGSLLALFFRGRQVKQGFEQGFSVVRTTKDRGSLVAPVDLTKSVIVPKGATAAPREGASCFGAAAAYDPSRDRVYVGYFAMDEGDARCRFLLTISSDGGRSWSDRREIVLEETRRRGIYAPAMAFNHYGVLGLMWRDQPVSDCWYFAASVDQGRTFTPAHPLSQCASRRAAPLTASSAALRFEGRVLRGSPTSAQLDFVLGLGLTDSRNATWRNNSLAATADGAFHPVWIERGSGEGQLRTATVRIARSREMQAPRVVLHERARDVTQQVALLYGGDQHYDISSGTLTVDIVLKNTSAETIRAPLLLKALTFGGELGKQLQIVNAHNRATGAGAVWDVSTSLHDGVLRPGASTEPYPIVFRVLSTDVPQGELGLSMPLHVLTSAVTEHSKAGY